MVVHDWWCWQNKRNMMKNMMKKQLRCNYLTYAYILWWWNDNEAGDSDDDDTSCEATYMYTVYIDTGGVKLRIPAHFAPKKKQIQCLSQWSRNENVRMPITIAQSPVIIRRLSCNAAFTKKQNLILVCFWQVYFCFLGPQQKLMAQTKPPRKSCKTSDLHRTAEIAIHTCIYVYVFTK